MSSRQNKPEPSSPTPWTGKNKPSTQPVWSSLRRSMTLWYGILTPPLLQVLAKQISKAVIPGSSISSSSSPQERPTDTSLSPSEGSESQTLETSQPLDDQVESEETPNGIRYSRGQDPFYLMHENQLVSMLRRAQAGESPDDLMVENWVNTKVANADDAESVIGDDDSLIIMVDLDDDEEDEEDEDPHPNPQPKEGQL